MEFEGQFLWAPTTSHDLREEELKEEFYSVLPAAA